MVRASQILDNVYWETSDQAAKGLGHAKSDHKQEKSCAADNSNSAAKLVQSGRVLDQFQHGVSSSICLKKPYCSDFVLARTKLEQRRWVSFKFMKYII